MSVESMTTVGVAVTCVVLLLLVVFLFRYGFIWLRALLCGAYVGMFDIICMTLRRIPPRLVVDTYIRFTRAGVRVSSAALQSHVLAGGDIKRVADWVVVTKNAGMPIAWEKAARLDLAQELPELEDVPKREGEELFRRLSGAQGVDG